MKIGKEIKKLRKLRGINQQDLAGMIDITPSYMSEIERGVSNPSVDLLKRVGEVMNSQLVITYIEI